MSPQILKHLPDISVLKRLCQSLAMLDAIVEPEWDLRYFSFNSQWVQGEQMASMRNGSGDDYFLLFSSAGAIIEGYAHEAHFARYFVEHGVSWPGVLDAVPAAFADFLAEPAFEAESATFCFWRQNSDPAWQMGPVVYPSVSYADGADDLLFALDNNAQTYQTWAEEYV